MRLQEQNYNFRADGNEEFDAQHQPFTSPVRGTSKFKARQGFTQPNDSLSISNFIYAKYPRQTLQTTTSLNRLGLALEDGGHCKAPDNSNCCRGPRRSITESENHRIVGVGRDLCGSSSPTPLLKQGHLQQAAQDLVQAGLEYLQRRRLHNLPGQPVPVHVPASPARCLVRPLAATAQPSEAASQLQVTPQAEAAPREQNKRLG